LNKASTEAYRQALLEGIELDRERQAVQRKIAAFTRVPRTAACIPERWPWRDDCGAFPIRRSGA
jgi:hypothetical protein